MEPIDYGKVMLAAIGIVEALKLAGLPTKYAAISCVIGGAVLIGLLSLLPPEYSSVLNGAIVGLVGTGFYGLVSSLKPEAPKPIDGVLVETVDKSNA